MSKILLVADDSVTIQRVVELTFAHEDVRVVSMSDGERTMEWLRSDRPDVVLVDVAIPEVDGYAIAEHVKTSKRLKDVPVLLMAGAFEPVDEARSRRIGCDGVIVKPFEPQHLVERVRELLAVNGNSAEVQPDPPEPPSDRRKQPAAPEGLRKVMTMPAGGPTIEELRREAKPRTTELPPVEVRSPAPGPAPAPPSDSSLPSLESLQARQTQRQAEGHPRAGAAPPAPIELELPDRPVWQLDADPAAPAAATPPPPAAPAAKPKVTLVNAFTALLAAEKSTAPAHRAESSPASAAISDAAVEEAVRRALVRMTDDLVRRIVVETAERLIKEEIEKITTDPE
jgi:DNA-binding response OmpR family regulator